MVLASEAGRLGHALGGAAGRRAKQQVHALGRENAQDRVDDGRLADAGPAGDDQRPWTSAPAGSAASGFRPASARSAARSRAAPCPDRSRATAACRWRAQQAARRWPARRDRGPPGRCRRVADRVGDHRALGQFEIERGANQLLRHLQQFFGQRRSVRSVGRPQWPSSIASVSA